jgi:RNA polymerase sigma factor (sigma-70 family)
MWQRNDGKSEANILQNQFTQYLMTAIRRRKAAYLNHRRTMGQYEFSVDFQEVWPEFCTDPDMLAYLPLQMQLENTALKLALEQMKERERYIFLAKVLDERSFEELATELGVGYKGIAAAYYRALEKVRKEMRGEEQ